jgi:hypothetical protein
MSVIAHRSLIVVGCLAAALGCGLRGTASAQAGEWTGRLQTGVVAIGGETTGVTLRTASATFELRLSEVQLAEAGRLDGETVRVRGRLSEVPGVEIAVRHIIDVDELLRAP